MNRICVNCGLGFEPLPHVPKQGFCSRPACQKARKRAWQHDKLHADPDYRHNQRAAQRAWQERNRDYWREYRACHRDCQEDARASKVHGLHKPPPEKMDASILKRGIYEVCTCDRSLGNTGTSWIVEIIPVRKVSLARWTRKERT